MYLMDYVRDIAVTDNNLRRRRIIDILGSIGCKYTVEGQQFGDEYVENIRVLFNVEEDTPRVIFGAHYDTVVGSTGANDNAAAVGILLAVIKKLTKDKTQRAIEIVFFDHEENTANNPGVLGSKLYLEKHSKEYIKAYLNLDICGVGEIITLAPKKNMDYQILSNPISALRRTNKHKIEILSRLPEGDDYYFEAAGIPNFSICMLTSEDVIDMIKIFSAKEGEPTQMPAIANTMHNGARDSIDVIEETAMESLLDWILDFINHI